MKSVQLISYSIILLLLTIFSYAFIDPNLIYMKSLFTDFAFQQRAITTGIYLLLLVALFSSYLYFLYTIKKKLPTFTGMKKVVIVTTILSFFAYPAMLSYDIFNYIAYAKILFHYHENPYLMMPLVFKGDPLLLFMHTANYIDVYGFIWTIFSGIPYLLGFGNFIITLFAFKLFIVGFYILALHALKRITNDTFTVLLFALNPLVILESLVSGHNDIVMMSLALYSLYLLKRKKLFLSILLLIISIFIKYVTIILLPVYIYLIIKEKTGGKIVWDKVYVWMTGLMFLMFLLTSFRSEIYPWYGQWFLLYAILVKNKWVKFLAVVFSGSLLLRDIPFMLLGIYSGPTPFIKTFVTFTIPSLVVFVLLFRMLYTKVIIKN